MKQCKWHRVNNDKNIKCGEPSIAKRWERHVFYIKWPNNNKINFISVSDNIKLSEIKT